MSERATQQKDLDTRGEHAQYRAPLATAMDRLE